MVAPTSTAGAFTPDALIKLITFARDNPFSDDQIRSFCSTVKSETVEETINLIRTFNPAPTEPGPDKNAWVPNSTPRRPDLTNAMLDWFGDTEAGIVRHLGYYCPYSLASRNCPLGDKCQLKRVCWDKPCNCGRDCPLAHDVSLTCQSILKGTQCPFTKSAVGGDRSKVCPMNHHTKVRLFMNSLCRAHSLGIWGAASEHVVATDELLDSYMSDSPNQQINSGRLTSDQVRQLLLRQTSKMEREIQRLRHENTGIRHQKNTAIGEIRSYEQKLKDSRKTTHKLRQTHQTHLDTIRDLHRQLYNAENGISQAQQQQQQQQQPPPPVKLTSQSTSLQHSSHLSSRASSTDSNPLEMALSNSNLAPHHRSTSHATSTQINVTEAGDGGSLILQRSSSPPSCAATEEHNSDNQSRMSLESLQEPVTPVEEVEDHGTHAEDNQSESSPGGVQITKPETNGFHTEPTFSAQDLRRITTEAIVNTERQRRCEREAKPCLVEPEAILPPSHATHSRSSGRLGPFPEITVDEERAGADRTILPPHKRLAVRGSVSSFTAVSNTHSSEPELLAPLRSEQNDENSPWSTKVTLTSQAKHRTLPTRTSTQSSSRSSGISELVENGICFGKPS